ncbi:MAG: plasmid stabilization protein [Ignavibacteria bacterium]|nr:MAG: plasmid stabilization protein [Ignavibacteria bacterium]
MPYTVYLTDDAARDLAEIHDFIAGHDSPANAEHVLQRIEDAFRNLSDHPQRGRFPKELLVTGLREFREISFKPYRIIYRVLDTRVYVLLITDGRRDMQTILQQRLFRG